MSDKAPIININDLELNDFGHGEKFAAKLGRIGAPLGMKKMGCGLVVLEPGKRAWPYHGHYVAEEAFIILEGEGMVEIDGRSPTAVGPGDVVLIPPLCRQRITNHGKHDLLFLAICSPPFDMSAYQDLE